MSLVAGNGADVVHAEREGFRPICQASVLYKPNDKLTLEGRRDHSTADVFAARDAETIVVLGAVATF